MSELLMADNYLVDPGDSRFFIEAGDGNCFPRIYFADLTEWHVHTFPDLMEKVSDEGWLTADALRLVSEIVSERVPHPVDDETGVVALVDEPSFALSMPLMVSVGASTVGAAWAAAWPFIAACINLTDPGTFGEVYLFAEVARRLEASA